MSASAPTPKGNFTVGEFLTWASIGRTSLYREIKAGRLKAVRCGARTLIRREDAEAWQAALPSLRANP